LKGELLVAAGALDQFGGASGRFSDLPGRLPRPSGEIVAAEPAGAIFA